MPTKASFSVNLSCIEPAYSFTISSLLLQRCTSFSKSWIRCCWVWSCCKAVCSCSWAVWALIFCREVDDKEGEEKVVGKIRKPLEDIMRYSGKMRMVITALCSPCGQTFCCSCCWVKNTEGGKSGGQHAVVWKFWRVGVGMFWTKKWTFNYLRILDAHRTARDACFTVHHEDFASCILCRGFGEPKWT